MATFEPIAIVGQGCVLPGAFSPNALWENVKEKRNLVTSVPRGRWAEHPDAFLGHTKDTTYSTAGGYVEGFERVFSPDGFAVPPDELVHLDPLVHWLLYAGRQALDDAGFGTPLVEHQSRAGLIVGNLSFPTESLAQYGQAVFEETYEIALAGKRPPTDRARDPRNRFMSGLPAQLAARALGLHGTAYALDAACASSLYALSLAADRLQTRQADLMLAGAVNRADSLFLHIGFCALQALSPSGQSRPFHRDADGLVPAEGAGIVVLMRLQDAIDQGRNIQGVIRGIGLSNDGRGKNLLAPSSEGQVRAMRLAYTRAGLQPQDVSVIECHATGTPTGDGTELESLRAVFSPGRSSPVRLGSLKSNLGHLITAAGIAGLQKMLGALKHRALPPTLHLEDSSWVHRSAQEHFQPIVELEPWASANDAPRRCGISAFGFGGNNAHLILEEWTDALISAKRSPAKSSPQAPTRIVCVALGAKVGPDEHLHQFEERLYGMKARPAVGETVTVALPGLRFPPNDLKQALPQQLLLLEATRDALEALPASPPSERTAVLVGMQCDVDVTTPGIRWQLPELASDVAARSHDQTACSERDLVAPPLTAQSVLGQMPNIPANRVNVQFDFRGPGFTLSQEELSGVAALEVAKTWLEMRLIDCAIVSAVDVSSDFRHLAAARALAAGNADIAGDAAVTLVLKREEDAVRDGDRIWGCIDSVDDAITPTCAVDVPHAASDAWTLRVDSLRTASVPSDDVRIQRWCGHPHAAVGLLGVAAAIVANANRYPLAPSSHGLRRAAVVVDSLGGATKCVSVSGPPSGLRCSPVLPPPFVAYVEADDTNALRRHLHQLLRADDAALRIEFERAPSASARVRLAVVAHRIEEVRAELQSAADALSRGSVPTGESIFWGEGEPRERRELALVFGTPGASASYFERDLLDSWPTLRELVDVHGVRPTRFESGNSISDDPNRFQERLASSWLRSKIRRDVVTQLLGLSPAFDVGFSYGAIAAHIAQHPFGQASEMVDACLGMPFFGRPPHGVRDPRSDDAHADDTADGVCSEEDACYFLVRAPLREIRRRVADTSLCSLTHVLSDELAVVWGPALTCQHVADSLQAVCQRLPLSPPAHAWCARGSTRALHEWLLSSLRSDDTAASDAPRTELIPAWDAARVASSLSATANLPDLAHEAYQAGARIFLHLDEPTSLAQHLGAALAGRRHRILALEDTRYSATASVARLAAQLRVLGYPCALPVFGSQVQPTASNAPMFQVPMRRSFDHLSSRPSANRSALESTSVSTPQMAAPPQSMPRAPTLVPILEPTSASPAGAGHGQLASSTPSALTVMTDAQWDRRATSSPQANAVSPSHTPDAQAPTTPGTGHAGDAGIWRALVEHRAILGEAHQAFLETQSAAHTAFMQMRGRQLSAFASFARSAPSTSLTTPSTPYPQPEASDTFAPEPSVRPSYPAMSGSSEPMPTTDGQPDAPTPLPTTSQTLSWAHQRPPQPLWDRADLERLASGPISAVFGPQFSRQDRFPRQVRMPEPPLLLCDRVMRIDAEPGVLQSHRSIFTETDVTWESWYLHEGRITPGVLIEAGQADLLLISYMGVDFENQGERVYRLLGCDLTYRGELPAAGSLLHYDIHIDGFATHGDTRIFFFHSDCRLGGPDGEVVLSVRNGQAGFFTDDELAHSGGILWSPADEKSSFANRPLAAPLQLTTKTSFGRAELEAWAAGDAYACFGVGFELAQTHVRTPKPPAGDMLLVDRVTHLDVRGGPWGRGYLRAELDLTPDRWFYQGHFKDDPCMPGTMMFEGCLETLAFYLAAQGFTLPRDGWRFTPVTDEVFALRCRGQAIPSSRSLVYEIFVKEVVGGDEPTVVADILATVDGLKALHCKDVGVRLTVDWPMYASPELLGERPKSSGWDAVGGLVAKPMTTSEPPFGQTELLATAWGRPSHAFGEMYLPFDGARRVPRLPGPPYHFMSRVTHVEGPPQGVMQSGGCVSVEYDVPSDAWYFHENPWPAMPFAVLLEVALQPCGWLSSYVGSALTSSDDLFYRNLDGRARILKTITPDVSRLTTTTTLTKVSQSGGMIIHQFDLRVQARDEIVFEGETTFGFFPAAALDRQVGITPSDEERERLNAQSPDADDGTSFPLDLRQRPQRYFSSSLKLPAPMLLMIDQITGFWPSGGRAGFGRVRAEKRVRAEEWFFKAHFFTDPVQPGSLGIEAMLQTLQWWMLHRGLGADVERAVFEPIQTNHEIVWKYRGQVIPKNACIEIELEVLEHDTTHATAEAWLWVDGLRIYRADIGMRIVSSLLPRV